MEVRVDKLPAIKPVLTMVQGEIEYEDPSFHGNTLRFYTETAKWEKGIKTKRRGLLVTLEFSGGIRK